MDSSVIVELIGVVALGILCLVSAISSWKTRRLMITVFGENPGPAQLSQRGYYVRLPDQVPPAAPRSAAPPLSSGAALGNSAARAPAPTVAPAAVEPGAPPATARESFKTPSRGAAEQAVSASPLPREEPAPETKPKPGTVPSSRRRPAVTAPDDLAALARDLDSADQALATADNFDSDEEQTKVLNLPTAEELARDKDARSGRTKTLVSEIRGVPSSARPEPEVNVIGVGTLPNPGDTPAPVDAR